MEKPFLKSISVLLFSVLITIVSHGQIIDFSQQNPYVKIFVDTDDFDSTYLMEIEEALDSVKNDTVYFAMLNDLAYYWHTRNLNTALQFTQQGLTLSADKKNLLWEGRFKITQGAILLRMEKLDEAHVVLEAAKSKVREEDLAFLNTQLGYVFERKGQLDRAADYAMESLRLGRKNNDQKAIALAFSDISNLLWKQSKFKEGLAYGLNAIEIFEARGIDDLDYDFTLYVLGNNYLSLGDYESALSYFEKSKVIGERYGFYNNLSDVYISLVDLYSYMGNFKEAESAGFMAVKYADLLENNFMIMRAWLSIGQLQNLEGKYDDAIESLNKCIVIATVNFGDEFFLNQAYGALGEAYAGTNNYEAAYQAFLVYDSLKDEVFTAASDQRISLLQTEFEVAQKEAMIEQQRTEIMQQNTRKLLAMLIAVLLLLLLVVLFVNFRNNRKKNKLLQKQNQEKEYLLKEIHHRVKNNLGVVSSLLALQSEQMDDPNMKDAMLESQNRVDSMSMIHQKLYQDNNLAVIEMKDYFINLGEHVLDSFGIKDRVRIQYTMESIEFDVDTALPLGLIVNELLTNALKYAFPGDRKGNINISLTHDHEHTMLLNVTDDGVGKNNALPQVESGFGTQLIKLLTHQLDGKIGYDSSAGTSVSLEFKMGKTTQM